MKLTNTVVQITVTIPEMDVDNEFGLSGVRDRVAIAAVRRAYDYVGDVEFTIIDCPSYPALRNE